MNKIDLVNQVKFVISNAIKDFRMASGSINFKPEVIPRVFKYDMPEKQPQSPQHPTPEPDFPCVIVRPSLGKSDVITSDNNFYDECNIEIVVLVSGDTAEERVEYTLLLMNFIEACLKLNKVVAKMYELQFPLSWQLYDGSQAPFFGGAMTTIWRAPSIMEKFRHGEYFE